MTVPEYLYTHIKSSWPRHIAKNMKQATARPLRTLILNTNHQLQAPSTSLSRSCRSHEPSSLERRPFSSNTRSLQQGPVHANRTLNAFRTPPQFHDALRLCSANNTLLLALFTTSACTPCRVITPLLTSLIETRPPSPPTNTRRWRSRSSSSTAPIRVTDP